MEEELVSEPPPLNRMIIAAVALIGVLISVYLTLHKFGYIGSLVCGTGSCEAVQASKWSSFMGIPVPVLGLAGYLALLIIALVGMQPAWLDSKAVSAMLLMLATIGFGFSVYLSYLEQFVLHMWCRWCIVSAIIATLIWLAALAELPRLRRTHESRIG